jgi:hypothetical protein
MTILHLTGKIDSQGELHITLPPGIPPGEVEVSIRMPGETSSGETWTDEEIQQALQITPKTGAEIAAMLNDMKAGFQHISDSAGWVEAHRRSRREESQW